MSTLSSERPRSKFPVVIVLLVVIVAALGGGGYYLWPRLESEPPRISVSPDADVFGAAPLEILVTDPGTGLKSVTATLAQGGSEYRLASEQFANPVPDKKIAAALSQVAGEKEGPAATWASTATP